MKFMKITLLIIWMLLTIILVVSLFGMLIFIPKESGGGRSTWMQVGYDLTQSIINDRG